MTADVGALSFARQGQGDRLLVIQGLSATQRYWGAEFLAELRGRFDVVTYDHRGVAGSTKRGTSFTMRDLAMDAAELIEKELGPSAGVFGVSMGGMVAQELALLRPDLIDYLVLGCTRSSGRKFGWPGDLATERLMSAYVHRNPAATRVNMFELSFSPSYTQTPGAWETYLDMTRTVVDPATSVRQVSAIRGFDCSDRLASLDLPVVVMHGDLDGMVPYEEGVQLARLVRNCRFTTVQGGGHFFWVERPVWTATVLAASPPRRVADVPLPGQDEERLTDRVGP